MSHFSNVFIYNVTPLKSYYYGDYPPTHGRASSVPQVALRRCGGKDIAIPAALTPPKVEAYVERNHTPLTDGIEAVTERLVPKSCKCNVMWESHTAYCFGPLAQQSQPPLIQGHLWHTPLQIRACGDKVITSLATGPLQSQWLCPSRPHQPRPIMSDVILVGRWASYHHSLEEARLHSQTARPPYTASASNWWCWWESYHHRGASSLGWCRVRQGLSVSQSIEFKNQ